MAAETAPHGRATQRPPAVNGEGQLDPCVLVLEGSIPNEKIKSEGYWAAMGTDE